MKVDAFRHCRCLRHLGNIMIAVVVLLQSLVYYAVASSYIRLLVRGSLGLKLLALLVLISFSTLVRCPWSCTPSVSTANRPRSSGSLLSRASAQTVHD